MCTKLSKLIGPLRNATSAQFLFVSHKEILQTRLIMIWKICARNKFSENDSAEMFTVFVWAAIRFSTKKEGKYFWKGKSSQKILLVWSFLARNNLICQRKSFPELNCLHEKLNAPAVMWHSAVKTAQTSAINRRHFFQERVSNMKRRSQGEHFSFSSGVTTITDEKWFSEVTILTGEQEVMPCEPKKYSRPKTTTAVCQTPSIRRPVTQTRENLEKLALFHKQNQLWINIYRAALVTSSPPFPSEEK